MPSPYTNDDMPEGPRLALSALIAADTGAAVDGTFAAWRHLDRHAGDNPRFRLLADTCTAETPFSPVPDLRTLTLGQPFSTPAAAVDYAAGAWYWTYSRIMDWLADAPQYFLNQQTPHFVNVRHAAVGALRRLADAAHSDRHLTIRSERGHIPRERYIRVLCQNIAHHAASLPASTPGGDAGPVITALVAILQGRSVSLPGPHSTHLPALRAARSAGIATLLSGDSTSAAWPPQWEAMTYVVHVLADAIDAAEHAGTGTVRRTYAVPAPNIHHITLETATDGMSTPPARMAMWRAIGTAHAFAADALIAMALRERAAERRAGLYAARAAHRSSLDAHESAHRVGAMMALDQAAKR